MLCLGLHLCTWLLCGEGRVSQTINATAAFLHSMNSSTSLRTSAAVNSSYLYAAIRVSKRIDLDKTINKATRASDHLQFSFADSGCSAQLGLRAMGELLGGANRINAVIGPGCSSACELTSYLATGQPIPQISYGCTASSLSDKDQHPLVQPSCPV